MQKGRNRLWGAGGPSTAEALGAPDRQRCLPSVAARRGRAAHRTRLARRGPGQGCHPTTKGQEGTGWSHRVIPWRGIMAWGFFFVWVFVLLLFCF